MGLKTKGVRLSSITLMPMTLQLPPFSFELFLLAAMRGEEREGKRGKI